MKDQAVTAFVDRFGTPPSRVVRSPGRVNLIGDHTDYCDGFVLPMAIDRAIWLALRPRGDGRVRVHSLAETENCEFELATIEYADAGWAEYVQGMARMLQDADYELTGWDGVLLSEVPIGSGLSSSAALEMAVGYAFSAVSDFAFDRMEMARLGQRAENEWVGANTGIMDQMICANGKEGAALLIDCRDLSFRSVALPTGVDVLIMDTMIRHDHTSSGYNERRESCDAAAEAFGVSHLRDLDPREFESRRSTLDDVSVRRVRHVLGENARVLTAAEAIERADVVEFGRLMDESHASLRDDFQVSNEQLDAMVEIVRAQPGSFGARMTGGGFGGCAVALVEPARSARIGAKVAAEYEAATGLAPEIFVTGAAKGTGLV